MSSSYRPPDDSLFLSHLQSHSKYKQRSHCTHHNIHLPELNARLGLHLDLQPSTPPTDTDPFAPSPDLNNPTPIKVIYLGNSMLERLKTTGKNTRLGQLDVSWNAGCGGDTNSNVVYRLSNEQGFYKILKSDQALEQKKGGEEKKCNIKVWILASGTNNLHPKRGLREADVESWKVLVQACLRIAPGSKVLACDMFYRKDVEDELVDRGNEMLREVVGEINSEMETSMQDGEKCEGRVTWVEVRHLICRDMLEDHVHLNEEGYEMWDRVLWPHVAETSEMEK